MTTFSPQLLTAVDSAVRTVRDAADRLPRLRVDARSIAAQTAWDSAATRRYHRVLESWDDGVGRLSAELEDECAQLHEFRAAIRAAGAP